MDKHFMMFLLGVPMLFSLFLFVVFSVQYLSIINLTDENMQSGRLKIVEVTYIDDEETHHEEVFGHGFILGTDNKEMYVNLSVWAERNGYESKYYWKYLNQVDSILDVKYIVVTIRFSQRIV